MSATPPAGSPAPDQPPHSRSQGHDPSRDPSKGPSRWSDLRRRLHSPHDREILRLAVPAFGALIAEPIFLLTDSIVVGHLGTPQLAGLGLGGSALQTFVGVFIFLAYATTAAVARQLGAGDRRAALEFGMHGVWLALGLGVVLAALGAGLAPQIIDLFGPSAEVAPYATTYLRISALGIPGMLVVFAGTGVLRGLHDVKTTLIVAAASYSANAVLSVVLVYPVGLGLPGSAWGTVLAQGGGAIAFVVIVVRQARRYDARLWPDPRGIVSTARAGVPLIVRTLTMRVTTLATTFVATSLGAVSLAAHQVAFTIFTTLAMGLDALAIAGQAIVGRSLGASDVPGVRAATRRMIEWGIVGGIVIGAALVLARPLYIPAFTGDPDVRALLSAALLVVAVIQPAAGVVFVLDGVLIGAGDGTYLAIASVLATVVFLPLAGLVSWLDGSLVALWWALGGWMLARLVTLVARERGTAWLVTGAVR